MLIIHLFCRQAVICMLVGVGHKLRVSGCRSRFADSSYVGRAQIIGCLTPEYVTINLIRGSFQYGAAVASVAMLIFIKSNKRFSSTGFGFSYQTKVIF